MKLVVVLLFVMLDKLQCGVLSQNCGELSYEPPSIAGRTIRFLFKPWPTPESGDTVTWRGFGLNDRNWQELASLQQSNKTKINDTFILDIKPWAGYSMIEINARPEECQGGFLRTKLEKDCGSTIMIDEPAIRGRYVRFRIQPPSTAGATGQVDWYTGNGDSLDERTSGVNISKSGGEIILDYMSTTDQHSIRVFANTSECSYPATTVPLQEDCGSIVYDEPAIRGRYVRFRLKPISSAVSNAQVEWYTFKNGSSAHLDHGTSTFKTSQNGTDHIIDSKTTTNELSVKVYAKMSGCSSPATIVTLQVTNLDNCGIVIMKQFDPGNSVQLTYFPDQAILDNPALYNVTWKVKNSACPDNKGCEVKKTANAGDYEFTNETFYDSPEYTLVIKSMDREKNGNYTVQCDNTRTTLPITVQIPVKPSDPVLSGKEDTKHQICQKCLVGKINTNFEIRCETHNGTNPEVNIYVKGQRQAVAASAGYYSSTVLLTESLNNATVKCEVSNLALKTPLHVETILYVAKQPITPEVHIGELKEGSPVNVTCTSTGGRPPASLSFKDFDTKENCSASVVGGQYASDSNSVIRLNGIDRTWNGRRVQCCTNPRIYNSTCSGAKVIDFKYAPVVSFDLDSDLVTLNKGESKDVKCIVDSNPDATVVWRREIDDVVMPSTNCGPDAWCMKLERVTRNQSGVYMCVAKNALSEDVSRQLTITVNGTESRQTAENITGEDGGPGGFLVPVTGAAVGIVLLAVLIIVLVVRKKRTDKGSVVGDDGRRGDARGADVNEGLAIRDHPTYANEALHADSTHTPTSGSRAVASNLYENARIQVYECLETSDHSTHAYESLQTDSTATHIPGSQAATRDSYEDVEMQVYEGLTSSDQSTHAYEAL